MKHARLLGGLVAASWVLFAAWAPGQQIQFPTRLPASTAVRTASAPATQPTTVVEEPSTVLPSQGPALDPAYIAAPEIVVTDPCFPTTTMVPCYPVPVCEEYKWRLFGDFLWLQARSAEVAYAVAINGAIVPPAGVAPVQIGPVATVDPGWTPAFRVGLSRQIGCLDRLAATYTRLESSDSDGLSVSEPNVCHSLVIHPGTLAVLPNFLDAEAGGGIDFDLIDVDYCVTFACDENYVVEYLIGARYAGLQQDFHATFLNGGTIEPVTTGIRFDGGGIRLGVEGERRSPTTGLLAYGRAAASFLAGRFRADYSQQDNFQRVFVDTGIDADRIVPILDLEFGVGWTGPREHLRLTAGYMISAWYNTVVTDEFIQAVRTNNFVGLSDTLTFDGLVGRVEFRF